MELFFIFLGFFDIFMIEALEIFCAFYKEKVDGFRARRSAPSGSTAAAWPLILVARQINCGRRQQVQGRRLAW
jgi:hypothetical protein